MKQLVFFIAAFACAAISAAAPLRDGIRQQPNGDIATLNFALMLEHLEAEFYQQGLARFGEADFRRANVPDATRSYVNFLHILEHEKRHVTTLETFITQLGGTPVPPCEFNFPTGSVSDFLKLSSALEKVGVSAYNGIIGLLQSLELQTAIAAIGTVEGRHASFLQTINGLDPFPASFDVALDWRQVVTLASPVIKQCPFDLGFAPFSPLTVNVGDLILPGSEVQVRYGRSGNDTAFCNFLFSDLSVVVPESGSSCRIPDEARGDVFLMITNSDEPVTVGKTNTIVAGPAVLYVDTALTDSFTAFSSSRPSSAGVLPQPDVEGTPGTFTPSNTTAEGFVPADNYGSPVGREQQIVPSVQDGPEIQAMMREIQVLQASEIRPSRTSAIVEPSFVPAADDTVTASEVTNGGATPVGKLAGDAVEVASIDAATLGASF